MAGALLPSCQLFGLRQLTPGVYGRSKVNLQEGLANSCLPGLLLPVSPPPRWALPTHASAGGPQHLQAGLAQSPTQGVLFLSLCLFLPLIFNFAVPPPLKHSFSNLQQHLVSHPTCESLLADRWV